MSAVPPSGTSNFSSFSWGGEPNDNPDQDSSTVSEVQSHPPPSRRKSSAADIPFVGFPAGRRKSIPSTSVDTVTSPQQSTFPIRGRAASHSTYPVESLRRAAQSPAPPLPTAYSTYSSAPAEVKGQFKSEVLNNFKEFSSIFKELYSRNEGTFRKISAFDRSLSMAAMLAAIQAGARRCNIQCDPNDPSIDEMLSDAYSECSTLRNDETRFIFESENIAFKPKALAASRVLKEDFSNTPVGSAPLEHRWRLMGISPCRIDILRGWFSSDPRLAKKRLDADHFLFGFLFDSASSYLYNVASGMAWAMNNMAFSHDSGTNSTTRRIDDFPIFDQLKTIHKICTEGEILSAWPGEIFDGFRDGEPVESAEFSLRIGHTITETGAVELSDFYRQLEESEELDPGTLGIVEVLGDRFTIRRMGIRKERMEALIKSWLKEYRDEIIANRSTEDPTERSDRNLRSLVRLIQKLYRLHPFRDGNSRVTCNVFSNEELAIVDDIRKFAGHSEREAFQLVRDAQKRTSELRTIGA